ncbi:MAG TPA: hypothetical protein VH107_20140 [Lacipirellulaceae bacterium]|nr:hypothetical protein [Lacipirellulaceae bacterium]
MNEQAVSDTLTRIEIVMREANNARERESKAFLAALATLTSAIEQLGQQK